MPTVTKRHRIHGERVRLEFDNGTTLDMRFPPHHHHTRPRLTIEIRHAGVTVSGKDPHVNLHDNKSADLAVVESDAAGFPITGADAVPVTWTVDDDTVVTLTDHGDGTARIDNVSPPAVGSSATVTATATLPDGTQAQGSLAVSVVSGPVTEIQVQATEVDPGA